MPPEDICTSTWPFRPSSKPSAEQATAAMAHAETIISNTTAETQDSIKQSLREIMLNNTLTWSCWLSRPTSAKRLEHLSLAASSRPVFSVACRWQHTHTRHSPLCTLVYHACLDLNSQSQLFRRLELQTHLLAKQPQRHRSKQVCCLVEALCSEGNGKHCLQMRVTATTPDSHTRTLAAPRRQGRMRRGVRARAK